MFRKEGFENADVRWIEVQKCNESLRKLNAHKQDQIVVEDVLAKSKIAWKIASLRQSYIWRLCELAQSCAINWNNNHYIASLTLARGVIETGVMLCEFDENVQKGLDARDLSFLDKDVMKKMFSTRIEELLGEEKEYLATNILTFIKKKEKELKGLESIYAHLSECAHPNRFGHFHHYGELDHSNGTVTFSNGKFLDTKFHSILCAFSFIDFGLLAIKNLTVNIEKIANLQHEINPVFSSQKSPAGEPGFED